MKIICGLGNPGKEYELTHHNMGFLAIDELAEILSVDVNKIKFKGLLGECFVNGEKVVLVKPQTYMNNSGECLKPIMDFYKAEAKDLLLIYDDIDLELGHLRVRKQGSSGSHNGMKSIIYHLGYDNFARVRVGIGRNGVIPLDKYVLMKMSDTEAPILKDALVRAGKAAECFIKEGIDEVMKIYNTNSETVK